MSHDEFALRYPQALRTAASRAVRGALIARGGPNDGGFVRFAYRPFDYRWLYYEPDRPLLDRPRADYVPHVFEGNLWMSAAQHLRRGAMEPQTCVTALLSSMHLIERGASLFPARLRDERGGADPNLSDAAARYLASIGGTVEDLFHHVLAVLHDPAYREANAGALRMGWPRIPLPGAADFARSAERGRELAALLDPDAPAPGVTTGPLRPELAAIAVPATADSRNMTGADFALTAGWGHYGTAGAVMPGQGRVTQRPATSAQPAALGAGACTSTTAPAGPTSPPRSGTTASAATRSSRSGSPTASAPSSAAPSSPTKSNTSPTPPAASPPCSSSPPDPRHPKPPSNRMTLTAKA